MSSDTKDVPEGLAKRYGINQKTVAKWKKRPSVADLPTGPKKAHSTVLSLEEEALIVAFRRHTLLPLDDCLYALQPTLPHLTRSSLHRCLQRHGISRLPDVEPGAGGSAVPLIKEAIANGEIFRAHAFEYACARNDIDHRTTKVRHPWTNGQVERMNCTIKDATVKRFYYESHSQLRQHLADFVSAYNYARRLKTLNGLTPYEFICKTWTSQPERFRLDPLQQMPGPNT